MAETLPFPNEGEIKVDIFQRQEIRKVMHEGEWWFSVKDVLEVLTGTTEGSRYSRDLRDKDEGLKSTWRELTRTLPFGTKTRGIQNATFINVEGLFRLMQSVPSAKAEPFKKWLAKVAFERLQEIQNPEIAIKRAITIYRAKGYDDDWIDARIRNKASRDALTNQWQIDGMIENSGILTDAISVATFNVNTKQHKEIKGLKSQSLRDNMTPIELTLTTLGEQATMEILKVQRPKSLQQHKNVCHEGGNVAGEARRRIEKSLGRKVVSSQNYLTAKQRENNSKVERSPGLNEILDRFLDTRN